MIVADTDVLIDALNGVEPVRSRIDAELSAGLATTAITSFELLSGARREKEKVRIRQLLAAMDILPLDPTSSEKAAEIRIELERAGKGIGMADYLIAGICVARNAMLITRNREHFDRVPGLVIARLSLEDR